MPNTSNILIDFKNAVGHLFESDEEYNLFLNTPEHWFSSSNLDQTPKEWLLYSRRKDRLDYAIRTVIELKSTVIG